MGLILTAISTVVAVAVLLWGDAWLSSKPAPPGSPAAGGPPAATDGAAESGSDLPENAVGSWAGTQNQTVPGKNRFFSKMQLKPGLIGQRVGILEFPGWQCVFNLDLVGGGAPSFKVRAVVQSGANCEGRDLEVTVTNDVMKYVVYKDGFETATGALDRQ